MRYLLITVIVLAVLNAILALVYKDPMPPATQAMLWLLMAANAASDLRKEA